MAQTLFVKTTDGNGKPVMKKVTIIRSWQESNGLQIYLHTNGVYGYKDGSPVETEKEFNIIADKLQKKAAIAWWNRAGQRLSQEFYQRQEEENEARNAALIPAVEGDASNLDAAQYVRRPESDRRKNAWSGPNTWFEWFEKRPEWWGFAPLIEIGGYRYKRIDLTEETTEEESPDDGDQPDQEPELSSVNDLKTDDEGPSKGAAF